MGTRCFSPTCPLRYTHGSGRDWLWCSSKSTTPATISCPQSPSFTPELKAALTQVLGEGYVLHPHRFCHNNEPVESTDTGWQAGAGTHAFIGWHQDSHSPLARPRHHVCRYAMVLYYPQDTPAEHGPTQLIPSTHFHRSRATRTGDLRDSTAHRRAERSRAGASRRDLWAGCSGRARRGFAVFRAGQSHGEHLDRERGRHG